MMKLDIQLFADGKVVISTELDTNDFKKGLDRMQNSAKGAGASIKGIVAGLGITKMISAAFNTIRGSMDDAISRLDTLNNFPKVMSNLGISTKEADKSIKKMSDKLSGLPTTLDQGAMAVQRFTAKNNDVKKSTDIFLALNNAILAGGASTEIQSTALEQMAQAYSKGKMDMMEWKAIQTAMPAQLNQVAKAMGVSTDELGEMMRQGDYTKETIDKFINTIIRLNKEGVDGFQNFEQQARNATGGIRTSIVVAKTQIVKGVADMISSLNISLKKAKLGSINEIIANLGKTAKKELDKIAKLVEKIDFKKLIKAFKTLIPIITTVTATLVAYRVAMLAAKAVNYAKTIIGVIKYFGVMIGLIKQATISQTALNVAQSMSPIGLITAGIVALTAALVIYDNTQNKVNQNIKKSNEINKQYTDNMKEIQKQKDQALSKSMNEIYYYQSLYDELKNITDANGKVKDGYEERAKFITEKLSEATGQEITMTDGVIDKYQELGKTFEETLEKKKALAYFDAHQQEYENALKEEKTLYKQLNIDANNREKSLKKMTDALDGEISKNKDLQKYREKFLQYAKGEIVFNDLTTKQRKAYNSMSGETIDLIAKETDKYYKYNEAFEKSSKNYAKNQDIIQKYRKAEAELAQGHYDTVAKIFNDTVNFNGKTKAENDKKYNDAKAGLEAYRNFLLENQDKYSKEFLDSEQQRIDKEIMQLEDEKNKANEKIKEKNAQTLATTVAGLNDQLSAIDGKKYEFRDAGNGLVQLYVDGQAKGKPIAVSEAGNITNDVIKKLNSGKIDAEEAGKNLVKGLAGGISTYSQLALNAAKDLGESVKAELQKSLEEHSPSKATFRMGKFLDEGLNIGIRKNANTTLKEVDNYGSNVIKQFEKSTDMTSSINKMQRQMESAVKIQQGKMSTNVQTGKVFNSLVATTPINVNLNAGVELDGQKVGRLITPEVSRTIKSGGGI